MTPVPFAVLHGGHGAEITALEYLYRVFLSLSTVGGIALLILWGSDAVETVRSALAAERDDGENGS